jgi:hypothetical protein
MGEDPADTDTQVHTSRIEKQENISTSIDSKGGDHANGTSLHPEKQEKDRQKTDDNDDKEGGAPEAGGCKSENPASQHAARRDSEEDHSLFLSAFILSSSADHRIRQQHEADAQGAGRFGRAE